jgi:hypothetical protein
VKLLAVEDVSKFGTGVAAVSDYVAGRFSLAVDYMFGTCPAIGFYFLWWLLALRGLTVTSLTCRACRQGWINERKAHIRCGYICVTPVLTLQRENHAQKTPEKLYSSSLLQYG